MPEAWMEFLRTNLPEPWMRAFAIFAVAVIVGLLAKGVLTRVVARLARRSGTDLDDQLIRIAGGPVLVTVVLIGVYFALAALGLSAESLLVTERLCKTLTLLVWVGAVLRMCRPVLESLARLADRVTWLEARTVPLVDNFGRVLMFVLAVYALLRIWDVNAAPVLASAGVVGLALGFAAKDTLANLFGGLFVIVDAPYKIGDYINLDSGERGEVTNIGLRSTRLLTRDDIEITIPNAQIAAAKINNEAGGRWEKSRVRVRVGVAYGSDVAEVKEVLMAAAESVEYALESPEPRVRFRALGESSLDFELLAWIEAPELRGRCVDALLTEIYNRLNAQDIGIPFPQRTVHLVAPPSAEQLRASF